MLLVANPNKVAFFECWIGHMDTRTHAVGPIHQERNRTVIHSRPTSLWFPCHYSSKRGKPGTTVTCLNLYA